MEFQIDWYLVENYRYFPKNKIEDLKEQLRRLDKEGLESIAKAALTKPGFMLFLSVFFGMYGVDRFILGQTGMGFLKFFTFGLFGVLTVFDWFTITKKTQERNYKIIIDMIADIEMIADDVSAIN